MRSLLVIASMSSLAHAEVRAQLHVGGGLEGGTITQVARPDAVMESGLVVDYVLPGRNWGFAASAEVVGRLTDVGAREEAKFDVMWRFVRADRRVRVGVGVGLRAMLVDEDGARETVNGFDLLRLDTAFTLRRWQLAPEVHVAIDAYVAWTFGCYHDTVSGRPVGDMLPVAREVRCADTITSTYTGGIAAVARWD